MLRFSMSALVCLLVAACGGGDDDGSGFHDGTGGNGGTGGINVGGTGGIGVGGTGGGSGGGTGGGPSVQQYPELWYVVDQLLVLVTLDADDGSVVSIQSSTITIPLESGQSAVTMLNDGSLLASRLGKDTGESQFFHIPSPPRDGSDVTPTPVGLMPDDILVEGLYTDCDGRIYAMDSGADDSSAAGNRLLRFTGNVAGGDFAYVVVSDLATADVADIDDMSPGIDNNQITDNPGLAIDTGDIYEFNFETGSGTPAATAGTFGMHALGGPLFTDETSRLYVLSSNADLFELDPVDFSVSGVIGTGPTPAQGTKGWSALAGPLTSCTTGFKPPE